MQEVIDAIGSAAAAVMHARARSLDCALRVAAAHLQTSVDSRRIIICRSLLHIDVHEFAIHLNMSID